MQIAPRHQGYKKRYVSQGCVCVFVCVCVCVCVWERERDRQTDRNRKRQRETERKMHDVTAEKVEWSVRRGVGRSGIEDVIIGSGDSQKPGWVAGSAKWLLSLLSVLLLHFTFPLLPLFSFQPFCSVSVFFPTLLPLFLLLFFPISSVYFLVYHLSCCMGKVNMADLMLLSFRVTHCWWLGTLLWKCPKW
jgi:hypothetical protein